MLYWSQIRNASFYLRDNSFKSCLYTQIVLLNKRFKRWKCKFCDKKKSGRETKRNFGKHKKFQIQIFILINSKSKFLFFHVAMRSKIIEGKQELSQQTFWSLKIQNKKFYEKFSKIFCQISSSKSSTHRISNIFCHRCTPCSRWFVPLNVGRESARVCWLLANDESMVGGTDGLAGERLFCCRMKEQKNIKVQSFPNWKLLRCFKLESSPITFHTLLLATSCNYWWYSRCFNGSSITISILWVWSHHIQVSIS